jgi:hypothetical protein
MEILVFHILYGFDASMLEHKRLVHTWPIAETWLAIDFRVGIKKPSYYHSLGSGAVS